MNKRQLRDVFSNKRSQLKEPINGDLSIKAMDNLINSDWYKKSNNIFCFVSFRDEIQTKQLIEHMIKEGKTISIPKIDTQVEKMFPFEIKSINDMQKGYYGIEEPKDKCTLVNGEKIDLIITPGLAFDINGYRLGYGKGYYDKFFSQYCKSGFKIGFAFDIQITDNVPHDEYDVKLDGIVTDKRIIYC